MKRNTKTKIKDVIDLEAKEPQTNGMAQYWGEPERFATEVLGSRWWEAQRRIATKLATHRRVAVKAANGVGKTYLAADMVLWFLYAYPPAIVLTTAPTWRQVTSLLWEEIRRRWNRVNREAEVNGVVPPLSGRLLKTELHLGDGHFAMGLSAEDAVHFQGYHAENLLVVLDEACGISESIWEAVEGICVGKNNRILAISNPLTPTGRFYRLFQSPQWETETISALDHPNILYPDQQNQQIPGATTRQALTDQIAEWCEPTEDIEEGATFVWEGQRYRPEGLFLSRALGQFPPAAEDSLLSRAWLEAAISKQPLEMERPCVLAVDVARFGGDETVFALRRGNRVCKIQPRRKWDTMQVVGETKAMAEDEGADVVIVDAVGVGAGVLDRLREINLHGVLEASFGRSAVGLRGRACFQNLRAQTFWSLRERLRNGEVQLPDDGVLVEQLAALRYSYSSMGQILIESKDQIRARGLPSPDRADAVAMLFCPLVEQRIEKGHNEVIGSGKNGWQKPSVW